MFQTKRFTVSQQLKKVSGGIAARNNHDVSYAGIYQRLNRVINHRPIVNGKQVLVGYRRQWMQPRTQSAC